ncbi:MAG: hypothetical protein ACFFCQ_13465, partial [Promethearchaeota archaeon]
MSSEKVNIYLVLDSGELEVVKETEPEKTYIVRNPIEQSIDIIKSGEGRKGFLASRIANRLRHEERGMRYRIRVVEPDERFIYLEMMKEKFSESFKTTTTPASSTPLTAQSTQPAGIQMMVREGVPLSSQIDQELVKTDANFIQKTQDIQDVEKSEE